MNYFKHNYSLWSDTEALPEYPRLSGHAKTDVLVVGGGMAGILIAHRLRRAGVDCLLLEADRICGGVTKNTTAKITAHPGLIYAELAKKRGMKHAALYLDANCQAMRELTELASGIDCDFSEVDSYIYSLTENSELIREYEVLKSLGDRVALVDKTSLPFGIRSALKFSGEGQFHPLKFARAIVKELNIMEKTRVTEIRDGVAVCEGGAVEANKMIVATHFPFINKHGMYFLKLYQKRSYVLGLEGAPPTGGAYIDASGKGLSFRDAGELLLLGGGGHRTGKRGGSYPLLEAFAKKYYPDAKIKYRWATEDCISLDGLPYIGEYSKSTKGLYVATGFNKWGMTSSMLSAMMLTELILGNRSPYAELLSPSRKMPLASVMSNGLSAAVSLLTPTAPRCPHLGCALKWNKYEHTWDCPCHGSRFDAEGHLLDGPSTGDIKPPKKTPPTR